MLAQSSKTSRTAKFEGESVYVRTKPKGPARLALAVGQPYERFLELPVALMLAVMWVAGVVLMGSGALVLYSVGLVLVRLMGGV